MSAGSLVPWAVAGLIGLVVVIQARRAASTREALLDSAHELARPLTALTLGMSAMGRSGMIDLAALEAEAERATSALDDLRRVACPQPRSRLDRFDLSSLVVEVARNWSQIASAQGRRLTVAVDSSAPVIADRSRIGQALTNLLANSLEHGDGTVRVEVGARGGVCRLEVVDDGVGIGERAVQPTSDPSRGRGLRIVGSTVSDVGGRLLTGRGSIIELPRAQVQ